MTSLEKLNPLYAATRLAPSLPTDVTPSVIWRLSWPRHLSQSLPPMAKQNKADLNWRSFAGPDDNGRTITANEWMGTFGTNALVVSDSMIGVGTASPTTLLTVNGTATATTFNATSTIRVKKNIRPLVDGISTIKKLKPSMFDRIDLDKNDDIGFIAEEMFKVIPSIVTKDDKDQCIGIDYGRLSTVLTLALIETLNKIEKLEEGLFILENKQ
jgi:hypothetical protein